MKEDSVLERSSVILASASTIRRRRGRAGLLGAVSAVAAACGASHPTIGAVTTGPDAATATSSGSGSGSGSQQDEPVGDAGSSQFTQLADGQGPLQVQLQVVGSGSVCGACDVVLAQVQGGASPYTYAWSDPSWTGPGPHSLCPTTSTSVSVTANDSSGSSTEGVITPHQTAHATMAVACTAGDASDEDSGSLRGCTASIWSGTPDGGTDDAGLTECKANEVDAAVAWTDGGVASSEASLLSATLLAGHTYEISVDRLLPLEIGAPVIVDVYGTNQPDICQAEQKLFTLTLDGSLAGWHQAYCFTPDQTYYYWLTNVSIQGVWGYGNPLSVSTICDSCTPQ